MTDVIQCPQCDKKFRLPENPPATFTCNQCGTLMDLSDFGGADQPEQPEPAAAAAPAGAPRSRRSRARGGHRGGGGGGAAAAGSAPTRQGGGRRRARRGAARGGGRGRGSAAQHDEYDDEPRGRRGGPQKSNSAAIIGVVAAVVVVVVLIVVASNKGEVDDSATGGGGSTAGIDGRPAGGGLKTTRLKTTPIGGTAGGAGTGAEPIAGDPSGGEPTGGSGATGTSGKKKRSGRYKRMSKVEFEIFDWPEEVDEETRAKVDECIKALYLGGRDATDAEEYLVGKGRPICGRLISEFKNISDSPGLDTKQGASLAGAIDAVLRKIDGWMERKWKELKPVRHSSHPNFTKRVAQRWTWWWANDEWKHEPRKPWDPFEDESDDTETGIKEPEKKKKKKGSGFSKRAGTGG